MNSVLRSTRMIIPVLLVMLTLTASTTQATDPAFSIYIDNTNYIGDQDFEFDIMVKASGSTSSFELRTFQAGIWVNSAWVQGGTLTLQHVSGSSQLAGSGFNGSMQWNAADNMINCSVNTGLYNGSSYIFTNVSVAPVRITRIHVTNSAIFPCATLPDFKFNYVQNLSPVRYRSSISWRPVSSNLNYDLFYPDRVFTGQANFNGELWTSGDADGRSPVSTVSSTSNISKPCSPIMHLTVFIQGMYTVNTHSMRSNLLSVGVSGASASQADTITVELHKVSDLSLDTSIQVVLGINGTADCQFSNGTAGNQYWVVIKHRNSIETWSAAPVLFSSDFSYDFSVSNNQAYQSGSGSTPQTTLMEPARWANYNGDVNHDGTVDINDMAVVDNDATAFAFGYNNSDITGDGSTDINDMAVVENNSNLFLYIARP